MKTNLSSLPPEIVQIIVESIEAIHLWELETGREYGINLPGGDSRQRRRQREERAQRAGGGGGLNGRVPDEDEEDDGAPLNPGDALMAMLGGLFGGGGGGGGPAAQPQPAAARPAANHPARPAQPAQTPAFTFGLPTPATNANPNPPADSSDEEMPALESVVPQAASSSTSVPSRTTSNTAPASSSTFNPPRSQPPSSSRPIESDSDDMPPLESVAAPSTSKGKAPAISSSSSNQPKKNGATNHDSDSDEMPPLESVGGSKPSNPTPAKPTASPSKPSTSTSSFASSFSSNLKGMFSSGSKKSVAAPTPKPQEKAKAKARDSDSDEMPALESVKKPPTTSSSISTSKGKAPAPTTSQSKKPAVDSDSDEMPPLESVSKPTPTSTSKANVPATTSSTSNSKPQTKKPTVSTKYDESDSDEMPSLEVFRPAATASSSSARSDLAAPPTSAANAVPAPATSTRPAAAANADSDEEMPSLERVGGGNVPSIASRNGGGGGGDPSDDDDSSNGDDEDEEDSDWHDDDSEGDEEENSDDDDEDESSEGDDSDISSIASDDCTYPDGLPLDPLLPLLFVSRPFLHATRKTLYKKIVVQSPFQGRLLLDGLREEKHAARAEDEEMITEFEEEVGEKGSKNGLARIVKSMALEAGGLGEMGRAGENIYMELIERCRKLQKLAIKPVFHRAATERLLKALNNLPDLNTLDISSGTARKHPFLVTTPRIFAIQRSCPELNDLTVQYLKGGEAGDSDEEDEMWEIADSEEEQPDEVAGTGGDEEEKGGEKAEGKVEVTSDKKKVVKRRGLECLALYDFDVSSAEISLILRDSTKTLKTLRLQRPGTNFTRFGFASTMLTFGHTLTILDLSLPSTWYPKPKLTESFKHNPPLRPKGYVHGKPSSELLGKVTDYHFILDAVMPYLPNLKKLTWSGPQATHNLFNLMPAGLTTVGWSHCPTVKPKPLAKILNKVINRTTTTYVNGSKTSNTVRTKVAKGLICLTVGNDDLSWSEEEIQVLERALRPRDCCLHLSSDAGPGLGMFGGGGGIPLGAGGLGVPFPIPLGVLGAGRG